MVLSNSMIKRISDGKGQIKKIEYLCIFPIKILNMQGLTAKQIELFEELHNSRSEDFKTFSKKNYRGVWTSIIDKYPETAHFIY